MINVRLYDDGFEINGHANYSSKGSDLVCAGVSSITQGIINCFDKKNIQKLEIKDGYIFFKIKQLSEKEKIILDVFHSQIKTIAKSNKKFIKILKEK